MIWRTPSEESTDLYPGLVVSDGRVSGSITAGRSRLPLWALVADMVHTGWPAVESDFSPSSRYDWGPKEMSAFLYNLLEARGEFGRLLLVLADVKRLDDAAAEHDGFDIVWWANDVTRDRVIDQLRRCLDVLDPVIAEAYEVGETPP